MFGIFLMVGYGLFRIFVLGDEVQTHSAQYGIEGDERYAAFTGFAMVALLARTFSSGCAALTGVEAISNGVPAFKKPKSKNAATTLLLLGTIAVTMLLGVVTLANLTGLKLIDEGHSYYTLNGQRVEVVEETAIGQLARAVFFDEFRPAFFFVVIATMIILFLAANTAFNGFPVLGSILARDGFLPRQLHTRGDRLAYSNGIILLAFFAIVLIVAFRADVTALIQLYVVGVFVSFTVSQLGMLRHWTRHLKTEQRPAVRSRMQRSRVINGVGLTMTGTVLVIVLLAKFTQGAYIAIIAMGVLFGIMKLIRRHYDSVARETALVDGEDRDVAQPGPGHRAGQQAAQAHSARGCLRQSRPAEHPGGADRLGGRRGDREAGQDLGGGQSRHPAQGGGLAVSRGDQPDHRLRPQHPKREPAGRGHGLHPRIRRRTLVGADPAQPERTATERPAAVHPGRDGHLGALPPRLLRPRRGADRAGDGPGERPPVAAGVTVPSLA